MHQLITNAAKGAAIGAAVGTAAYALGAKKGGKGKNVRKSASRAIKTIGNVMENVAYLMK